MSGVCSVVWRALRFCKIVGVCISSCLCSFLPSIVLGVSVGWGNGILWVVKISCLGW